MAEDRCPVLQWRNIGGSRQGLDVGNEGLGGSAQASEVEGELHALPDLLQQLLQVYPPKVTAACAQCAREGNVQGGV